MDCRSGTWCHLPRAWQSGREHGAPRQPARACTASRPVLCPSSCRACGVVLRQCRCRATRCGSRNVRNGKTDVAHFSLGSGFRKTRVIPRPFDVEQTPHLVDLTLLLGTASSGFGRRVDQSQRHGATRIQVYANVNGGRFANRRLLIQGPDVVGLGLRAFTEHQEGTPGSAQRDLAAERWVLAPPVSCPLGLSHREAEKRAQGLCGRRPGRLRERPRTGPAGRLSPGSGTSSRVHLRTRPDQRDA